MAEDKVAIARGYQRHLVAMLAGMPLAVAYFADIKWVIAVGFALTIVLLHESVGRLHDLIVRTRRTNRLLIQNGAIPAEAQRVPVELRIV